jgi:hypothetical protein
VFVEDAIGVHAANGRFGSDVGGLTEHFGEGRVGHKILNFQS